VSAFVFPGIRATTAGHTPLPVVGSRPGELATDHVSPRSPRSRIPADWRARSATNARPGLGRGIVTVRTAVACRDVHIARLALHPGGKFSSSVSRLPQFTNIAPGTRAVLRLPIAPRQRISRRSTLEGRERRPRAGEPSKIHFPPSEADCRLYAPSDVRWVHGDSPTGRLRRSVQSAFEHTCCACRRGARARARCAVTSSLPPALALITATFRRTPARPIWPRARRCGRLWSTIRRAVWIGQLM